MRRTRCQHRRRTKQHKQQQPRPSPAEAEAAIATADEPEPDGDAPMSPHAASPQDSPAPAGKNADMSGVVTRPRRPTIDTIEETILRPGTVKINVQGAFIVDDEHEPSSPQSEDYEHDPRDIRLPNHTAVVSHIAVDVSLASP